MELSRTFIRKEVRDGWRASDSIPMGQAAAGIAGNFVKADVGQRLLSINTHKADGGRLITDASCGVLRSDGTFSMIMCGDFSERFIVAHARCTEKTVREQHAKAMQFAPQILARAEAFYAAKAPKLAHEEREAVAA